MTHRNDVIITELKLIQIGTFSYWNKNQLSLERMNYQYLLNILNI